MKELAERFIRSHPENRYNITKNENEYKLSFFLKQRFTCFSCTYNIRRFRKQVPKFK